MPSIHRFAALCLLAVIAVSAQTSAMTTMSDRGVIPSGKRALAPDFTIAAVDGKPLSLSSYRGSVVLLDFWATTCGGCKVELPWYVDFHKKYQSRGLALIGLDMYGETAETVKTFAAKWRMDYPLAIGTDALGDKFGLTEMPLTVLIDRNGRIAVSHAGIVDKTAFEEDIQQLLQER